jgi:hypothetical protein
MTNKQAKLKELNAIKSENAKKAEMSLDEIMDAFAKALADMVPKLEQMSKVLAKVAKDVREATKDER